MSFCLFILVHIWNCQYTVLLKVVCLQKLSIQKCRSVRFQFKNGRKLHDFCKYHMSNTLNTMRIIKVIELFSIIEFKCFLRSWHYFFSIFFWDLTAISFVLNHIFISRNPIFNYQNNFWLFKHYHVNHFGQVQHVLLVCLVLFQLESNGPVFVRHFQYKGWTKQETLPTKSSMISLLLAIEKWQQRSGNTVIVVHCM